MRLLRILLRLLPDDFRREYGDELLQTAELRWREKGEQLNVWGRLRFLSRQWIAAIRVSISLRKENQKRNWTSGILLDARHSIRAMLTRPGFTLVAMITMGLGIGAATTMFSVFNTVILKPLPFEDPDRIVSLKQIDTATGTLRDGVSAANLFDLAQTAGTISHAAFAEAHGLRLLQDGRAVSLRAWLVSEGFFDAMQISVALGRSFSEEEFTNGSERVVLLSHRTWQDRFGEDLTIVGKEVVLDGVGHTVVGVLPMGFRYPSDAELWGPRPKAATDTGARDRATLHAVARLAPGVSLSQAQNEIDQIASRLTDVYPTANANMGLRVVPLRRHLFGEVRTPIILMMSAVGVVLLIAVANLAGLQLARGTEKSREYALRSALGGASHRIIRLVIIENLLLTTIGGVFGVGLAHVGVGVVRVLGPDDLSRATNLQIDTVVLVFACLAAAASAVVAGAFPALRTSRIAPHQLLGQGPRGSTRIGGSKASDRLVISQIALALVLSLGAGLMLRSFDKILNNQLGFDPNNRLAAQVWAYNDNHEPQFEFFQRGLDGLRALPGVESAGLTSDLPLADDRSLLSRGAPVRFIIDGRPPQATGREQIVHVSVIDSGYTATMGISRKSGRGFSTRDRIDSPPVVMVNESFVRRYLGDVNPIGQRITLRWRSDVSREIVGVLSDVRQRGFESVTRPEIYAALSQAPSNGLTFVVKAAADATFMIGQIRDALWEVDPTQATWAIQPLTDLLSESMRQRRFSTALLGVFAVVALSLSAIGIYALISFSMEQRVREIGIRRALGGGTSTLLGMVLRRGLYLGFVGSLCGLAVAAPSTRLMRGMLFEIAPTDPVTFAMVPVIIIGVTLTASFIPARHALRVDPMIALRKD